MTVYLDILILVNMVVNYFLLKATAVLCGAVQNRKRIIISSVVGALFSLLIFVKPNILISFAVKIFSLIASIAIAFKYNSIIYFLKLFLCSSIVNTGFTGLIMLIFKNSKLFYTNNGFYYIGISPVIFVIAVLLSYILFSALELLFADKCSANTYNVNLKIDSTDVSTVAFYDSGFKVKDILTNRPVVMCSINFIKKNYGFVVDKTNNFTGNITPVFFSSVSGSGMLPGIKADSITVYSNSKGQKIIPNILIMVTDEEIFIDAQIIFGKEIFNIIGD